MSKRTKTQPQSAQTTCIKLRDTAEGLGIVIDFAALEERSNRMLKHKEARREVWAVFAARYSGN